MNEAIEVKLLNKSVEAFMVAVELTKYRATPR
jgi:hypothetical protein